MKLNFSDLKAKARGCLEGRYATILTAYVFARFLTNLPTLLLSYMPVSNPYMANILDICMALVVSCLTAIFVVGQNRICLKYARSRDLVPVKEMWYGFQHLADQTIITYFLMVIRMLIPSVPFIVCMYLLSTNLANPSYMVAAIITGIFMLVADLIIYLDYTLVYFLIPDHPDMDSKAVLAKSKELMKGRRLTYLGLLASFIGMYLLGILSFGIGLFWVCPYIKMTVTGFYLQAIGEKTETEQLLDGKLENPDFFKEVY